MNAVQKLNSYLSPSNTGVEGLGVLASRPKSIQLDLPSTLPWGRKGSKPG